MILHYLHFVDDIKLIFDEYEIVTKSFSFTKLYEIIPMRHGNQSSCIFFSKKIILKCLIFEIKVFLFLCINKLKGGYLFLRHKLIHALHNLPFIRCQNFQISNAWQTHMIIPFSLTTPSAYSIWCDIRMRHFKMHKMRLSGCCYCHSTWKCMCVPNALQFPMQQCYNFPLLAAMMI